MSRGGNGQYTFRKSLDGRRNGFSWYLDCLHEIGHYAPRDLAIGLWPGMKEEGFAFFVWRSGWKKEVPSDCMHT